MYKVAILDDSPEDSEEILYHLTNTFSEIHVRIKASCFTKSEEFLKALKNNEFDVLFLDIVMPEQNGFDIAKKLREMKNELYIIFVTYHNDLVYESFDYTPFQFLTKDDLYKETYLLKKTVTRLIDHKKKDVIFELFDESKDTFEVSSREIYYIENDKHYLNYYTSVSDHPLRERANISEREEYLKSLDIVRIHRKYLVNIKSIRLLDNQYDQVILKNGTKLPISRTYKKQTEMAYKIHIRTTV